MKAAVILGLGCSPRDLKPFQADRARAANTIDWRMGMPSAGDQADVIVLFGGDGTVHRHLGQLVKLCLPVLVVPAGSGNDFARALGLRRVRDSLSVWEKFCAGTACVRRIDLGVITPLKSGAGPDLAKPARNPLPVFHYFCCVAGVGIDGEVSRRANHLPRWVRGQGGYVLSLLPTIFTFAPVPTKILTPGVSAESWTTRSDQPTILAAFANTPVYGGGMKVAPQAKMDDGLLDVCIVGGVSPLKLLTMFPSVYTGQHLKFREVEYFHSDRVRVETESPFAVYADGEYVCETPAEVGIHSAALKVVTL